MEKDSERVIDEKVIEGEGLPPDAPYWPTEEEFYKAKLAEPRVLPKGGVHLTPFPWWKPRKGYQE